MFYLYFPVADKQLINWQLINYSYIFRVFWLVFKKTFGKKLFEVEPVLLQKFSFRNLISESLEDTLQKLFEINFRKVSFCSVYMTKINFQKLNFRNFLFRCIRVQKVSFRKFLSVVYTQKLSEIKFPKLNFWKFLFVCIRFQKVSFQKFSFCMYTQKLSEIKFPK